jgi:hypothetical protein
VEEVANTESFDHDGHDGNRSNSENHEVTEGHEEDLLEEGAVYEEVAELPEELASLRGRQFESEVELQEVLDELGCSDYRVELDNQGFAYTKALSVDHNLATTAIHNHFSEWQLRRRGWGCRWRVATTSTIGLDLPSSAANINLSTIK